MTDTTEVKLYESVKEAIIKISVNYRTNYFRHLNNGKIYKDRYIIGNTKDKINELINNYKSQSNNE